MALVRQLVPEDAEALRILRLEAPELHPEAFGSSHAEESARPVDAFAAWTTGGYIAGGFVDDQLDAMAGLSVPKTGLSRCTRAFSGASMSGNAAGAAALPKR